MPHRIRFDRFELRPTERQLLRDGSPVQLGARAFDLLLLFVSQRDRLLTKAELLDKVWPGLLVEEANVQVQVSALRKVLGSASIATIPGLGYRWSMSLDADDTALAQDTAPSADAEPSRPSNLPAVGDAPIGRASDLWTLGTMLDAHRVVTVVGPGGVGKTSVALAAARQRADRHVRGVWWVDLAALSSADQIVPSIAKAANLSLGASDALAALVRALSAHDLLLVLDNCEHLSGALSGIVQSILEGTTGVSILATSQQALKVRGEQVLPLSPLSLPNAGMPIGPARACSAMRLLELRAGAVDHRFAVNESNLAQAIALCRHLEGLPLAIEMAAARLPLLGFAGLQPLMAAPLDRLRARLPDAPERQRTLRQTLDWSHSLLGPDEQSLLRRLSIFAGSFRLQVAQDAAGFGNLTADDVIDALVGLVEKSLVKVVEIEPPRYRLLEATRLYAHDRLVAAGEADPMLSRHGAAMANLAEVAEREARQWRSTEWLSAYLPDYDDMDLAFNWAFRRSDAEVAAAVVVPLRLMDQLRGLFASSGRRVDAALALLEGASPLSQARLHSFVASCGWIDPSRGTRVGLARRAVALWRDLDDPRELHGALAVAATECARIGEHDEAAALLAQARALEAADWPGRKVAVRTIHEGWVAHFRGDAAACRDSMRAAVSLCERDGERAMACSARVLAAHATLATGDIDEAVSLARAAIEQLGSSNQSAYLGYAWTVLGHGLFVSGDITGARLAAARALQLTDASASHAHVLLCSIALLALSAGDSQTAAQLLGHVLQGPSRPDRPIVDAIERQAREAWKDLEASLGSTEASRLRAAGEHIDVAAAFRLAQKSLSAAGVSG